MVTKTMSNGVALFSHWSKIKELIIRSVQLVQPVLIVLGMQLNKFSLTNVVFAGGAEEEHWTMSYLFDAMGAMSSKFNDTPETASEHMIKIEMDL